MERGRKKRRKWSFLEVGKFLSGLKGQKLSASPSQGSWRELSPTEKELMDYFFNSPKDDTSIILNVWERSPSITLSERLRELALNSSVRTKKKKLMISQAMSQLKTYFTMYTLLLLYLPFRALALTPLTNL